MSQESSHTPSDRCRLVLCMGPSELNHCNASQLDKILAAGDVASILFFPDQMDDVLFQKSVELLVPINHQHNVASIIVGDSRVAGRIGADGLQLGQDIIELKDAIEKFSPGMMVGAANVKTRHNALMIGELQPDYLMFGKPGGDIRPQPHPKNLALGQWWSVLVEIPCIVMGGTELSSAVEVAQSGAEFAALGKAIFAPDGEYNTIDQAPERVREVNQLLNEHAPRFEPIDD